MNGYQFPFPARATSDRQASSSSAATTASTTTTNNGSNNYSNNANSHNTSFPHIEASPNKINYQRQQQQPFLQQQQQQQQQQPQPPSSGRRSSLMIMGATSLPVARRSTTMSTSTMSEMLNQQQQTFQPQQQKQQQQQQQQQQQHNNIRTTEQKNSNSNCSNGSRSKKGSQRGSQKNKTTNNTFVINHNSHTNTNNNYNISNNFNDSNNSSSKQDESNRGTSNSDNNRSPPMIIPRRSSLSQLSSFNFNGNSSSSFVNSSSGGTILLNNSSSRGPNNSSSVVNLHDLGSAINHQNSNNYDSYSNFNQHDNHNDYSNSSENQNRWQQQQQHLQQQQLLMIMQQAQTSIGVAVEQSRTRLSLGAMVGGRGNLQPQQDNNSNSSMGSTFVVGIDAAMATATAALLLKPIKKGRAKSHKARRHSYTNTADTDSPTQINYSIAALDYVESSSSKSVATEVAQTRHIGGNSSTSGPVAALLTTSNCLMPQTVTIPAQMPLTSGNTSINNNSSSSRQRRNHTAHKSSRRPHSVEIDHGNNHDNSAQCMQTWSTAVSNNAIFGSASPERNRAADAAAEIATATAITAAAESKATAHKKKQARRLSKKHQEEERSATEIMLLQQQQQEDTAAAVLAAIQLEYELEEQRLYDQEQVDAVERERSRDERQQKRDRKAAVALKIKARKDESEAKFVLAHALRPAQLMKEEAPLSVATIAQRVVMRNKRAGVAMARVAAQAIEQEVLLLQRVIDEKAEAEEQRQKQSKGGNENLFLNPTAASAAKVDSSTKRKTLKQMILLQAQQAQQLQEAQAAAAAASPEVNNLSRLTALLGTMNILSKPSNSAATTTVLPDNLHMRMQRQRSNDDPSDYSGDEQCESSDDEDNNSSDVNNISNNNNDNDNTDNHSDDLNDSDGDSTCSPLPDSVPRLLSSISSDTKPSPKTHRRTNSTIAREHLAAVTLRSEERIKRSKDNHQKEQQQKQARLLGQIAEHDRKLSVIKSKISVQLAVTAQQQAGMALEKETNNAALKVALLAAAKLGIASKNNDVERVQLLITDAYADTVGFVNSQDTNGSSSIFHAAWPGHHKVIDMLIDNGADVDLQNNRGNTAMHLACYQARERVITSIINAGGSPLIHNLNHKRCFEEPATTNEQMSCAVLIRGLLMEQQKHIKSWAPHPVTEALAQRSKQRTLSVVNATHHRNAMSSMALADVYASPFNSNNGSNSSSSSASAANASALSTQSGTPLIAVRSITPAVVIATKETHAHKLNQWISEINDWIKIVDRSNSEYSNTSLGKSNSNSNNSSNKVQNSDDSALEMTVELNIDQQLLEPQLYDSSSEHEQQQILHMQDLSESDAEGETALEQCEEEMHAKEDNQ